MVEADGSYHLTTFVTRDGAPVGDFAVTVIWPGPPAKGQVDDEPGPDRLLQRYARSKKPAASVHIGPETTELATIDLKSAEKPKAARARNRTWNNREREQLSPFAPRKNATFAERKATLRQLLICRA